MKKKNNKKKNRARMVIKWQIEKDRLTLVTYYYFMISLFCLAVSPFIREKFDVVWWGIIFAGIMLITVCKIVCQRKKTGYSLLNLVTESCRCSEGHEKFKLISDCIRTYKSDLYLYVDDKSRILNNVRVLEASLAQEKAVIIIMPTVFTVFAWFVGKNSISFEKLVAESSKGSLDSVVIICLVLAVFMVLKVVIKQYPENAYIKKVIESIREELQEMNEIQRK